MRTSHQSADRQEPPARSRRKPAVERPAQVGGRRQDQRDNTSSGPRRLAVIAVATTLATAAAGMPQAAAAETLTKVRPSAQAVVVSEPAASRPPASVTGLARDLGVSTGFAWRTLDELARSAGTTVLAAAPRSPGRPA